MTMTQDKEGARYDMGERNAVADMIEAAAKHIGAQVHWHDPKKSTLRFHATIAKDDEEVCVEAVSPKIGARITSDDQSRYWDYTGMASLAAAIKRRMRSAKARDAEQRQRWAASEKREAAEKLSRDAARVSFTEMFGEELVEAALHIDAEYLADKGHAVARVNVYVGRKIDGQKLSMEEAVRFIQTMKMGGYDLVKMNEEKKS